MSVSIYALYIFILTLISIGLSGAETSYVAASNPRLHRNAKGGSRTAKVVLRLRKQMGRLLGSLLIANTLVNILASALATHLLITIFGESGLLLATFMMTTILVVFAEVMPKMLALNYPEQMSQILSPFINFIYTIVAPLTRVAEIFVQRLLRLFGIHIQDNYESTMSLEDLRSFIDLHRGASAKQAHEFSMLKSILDLADVDVMEIMVHRKNALMLNANDSREVLMNQILGSPYSRLPVWVNNPENIVGILHVRNYLKALSASGNNPESFDIMTLLAKPWFVPETVTLLDQLQAFRARREHFAIVIDEYGSFMGILTLEDILEEIVGEISDEFDIEMQGVVYGQDGELLVEGITTIRDLNRQFDWDLKDDYAATLAGIILHESRDIPSVGQTFLIQGFKMQIMRKIRNQISLIKVTPLPKTPGE